MKKGFRKKRFEKVYVADIQLCPKEGEVFCRLQFIGGNDFIVVPPDQPGKVVFVKKGYEYLIAWNMVRVYYGDIINFPDKGFAVFIPDESFPVTGDNIRDNVLKTA